MSAGPGLIDPEARWARAGLDKPEYAGLLSYAGLPYAESPELLAGFDVAIVGAPMDELCSDRPGARLGPRGIRAAGFASLGHLEAGVSWGDVLRVIDYGDAPVVPADPARSHLAIEAVVGEVVEAGLLPIVLGGDHSITEPALRAVAKRQGGPIGLIHFDTHSDTNRELNGVELSHGTPMYRLVEQGHVDPRRYVQLGLRGYAISDEFAWQRERGISTIYMHDIRAVGVEAAVRQALELVGDGPVYLTVDIDVLDPAFAPGTGTPEPGGMTSADLLLAVRTIAAASPLVGADVVEVLPTLLGSADVTAVVGDRVVREMLVGTAIRRGPSAG